MIIVKCLPSFKTNIAHPLGFLSSMLSSVEAKEMYFYRSSINKADTDVSATKLMKFA